MWLPKREDSMRVEIQNIEVLPLLLLGGAISMILSGCGVKMQNGRSTPRFAELSGEDAVRLDNQRALRITSEQLAHFEKEWRK